MSAGALPIILAGLLIGVGRALIGTLLGVVATQGIRVLEVVAMRWKPSSA